MSSRTLPERPADGRVRRARDLRRLGTALLLLFVLAGASGLLGTRTTRTTASGAGYELVVVHPAVSRSGHAVRVTIEVRRPGGFDTGEPVRLRLLSSYFDLFDENAFTPQPDAETADATYTFQEFVPPRGEAFRVGVDTRVEPARNTGERGEVSVVDDQGRPLVTARFRTYLLP